MLTNFEETECKMKSIRDDICNRKKDQWVKVLSNAKLVDDKGTPAKIKKNPTEFPCISQRNKNLNGFTNEEIMSHWNNLLSSKPAPNIRIKTPFNNKYIGFKDHHRGSEPRRDVSPNVLSNSWNKVVPCCNSQLSKSKFQPSGIRRTVFASHHVKNKGMESLLE